MKRILVYSFIFVLNYTRLVFGNYDNPKPLLTTNQLISNSVEPLCFKRNATGIVPCGDRKSFQACLHIPTGTIQICGYKTRDSVPLCYLPFFRPHYVLKCDKPSSHICMTSSTDVTAFSVCEDSSVKACLWNDSLKACEGRFKRQGIPFPQLDVDGYYASCENCDLHVKMILDENSNERPIIEIKTEPQKKGKSQDD